MTRSEARITQIAAIPAELFDGLSEEHVACLYGLMANRSPKEIGERLGLSARAVDAKIDFCLKHLEAKDPDLAAALAPPAGGGGTRARAAAGQPQSAGAKTPRSARPDQKMTTGTTANTISDIDGLAAFALTQQDVGVASMLDHERQRQLNPPLIMKNRMNVGQRLAAIIAISLASAALMAMILMGFNVLSSFY